MSEYHASIEGIPMPASIRALPIDPVRKLPAPWFIAMVDGAWEFRIADQRKLLTAVHENRCWICGGRTNNRVTFVAGPMCTVNRISAEPPSHLDCAVFSARACPFLSRPRMVRREGGLPEESFTTGVMVERNPGVTCLWTTKGYHLVQHPDGILFRMLPPTAVAWWTQGRLATRAEVAESFDTGMPTLREINEGRGREVADQLERAREEAMELWPRD